MQSLPIIAHESINDKLQTIWQILLDNQHKDSLNPSRYPGGFKLFVENNLDKPTKIRGQLGVKYYSIAIDYDCNEISIKYTDFSDMELVFSNQSTETSHVNQRGKVMVTEWCVRPTHRTKRQIPRESLKKANEMLDLIIDNLARLFKYDKIAA